MVCQFVDHFPLNGTNKAAVFQKNRFIPSTQKEPPLHDWDIRLIIPVATCVVFNTIHSQQNLSVETVSKKPMARQMI